MKKIALFLSIAALVASCKNLADNEYEVTGTVDPSWEGRTVILEKQSMMGLVPVDTAKVEGAKFTFKDTISAPELYLISVEGIAQQKLDFILEPGSIDIEVDKDTLGKSVADGTFNNDKYQEFKKINLTNYKKIQKFDKDNLEKGQKAQMANDTVAINQIMKGKKEIIKGMEEELVKFIKDNPKAYANLRALGYVNQMGFRKPEEVKALFDNLDASLKKTAEGKQIADYFKQLDAQKNNTPPAPQEPQPEEDAAPKASVKVGDAAPQFSAPAPDGKQVSLTQAMGKKVTIIDFWASWCPPCRAENPNVVALYKKYHDKGLNIVGVSLDKTADAWKKAIADDKLTWNHISNLKYWDEPIAKQYGVEQVPTMFVLDASGKVVAKDLRGAALEAKVKELL